MGNSTMEGTIPETQGWWCEVEPMNIRAMVGPWKMEPIALCNFAILMGNDTEQLKDKLDAMHLRLGQDSMRRF